MQQYLSAKLYKQFVKTIDSGKWIKKKNAVRGQSSAPPGSKFNIFWK
jgi:hypothetical protein